MSMLTGLSSQVLVQGYLTTDQSIFITLFSNYSFPSSFPSSSGLWRGEEKPASTSIDLDFFLCYLRDRTSIRFLSKWVVLIWLEIENDVNASTTVNITLSYFSNSMKWIPEQASVYLQLLFHHFQERVFVLSKTKVNGIR